MHVSLGVDATACEGDPYSYIPVIVGLDGYISMGTEVSVTKKRQLFACWSAKQAGLENWSLMIGKTRLDECAERFTKIRPSEVWLGKLCFSHQVRRLISVL